MDNQIVCNLFEKLDVYQASIGVVVLIDKITEAFPRGRVYLTNQLQRAETSISLHIAEGSDELNLKGDIILFDHEPCVFKYSVKHGRITLAR